MYVCTIPVLERVQDKYSLAAKVFGAVPDEKKRDVYLSRTTSFGL